MDEFRRTSVVGAELLFRLTEALCALPCLASPAGRLQFADLLSPGLRARVPLRGVRLREDVVTLVRAALSESGGEWQLFDAVRVLEGAEAAEALEREFASWHGASAPAPEVSGPLSQREVSAARTLLVQLADWLPGTELSDRLGTDLGIDLPTGLNAVQLFEYVLALNVQPDGLPPAVLLMDVAAGTVRISGRRADLSRWSEEWAARAGLRPQLEERRAARQYVRADPSVPRCLVVVVEPTRDGTGDVVVRPWLNTVPGRWNPVPAEPVTTTLDGLGPAVETVLRQLARLSPPSGSPPSSRSATSPCVEFVLPYDLLNHDMAGLTYRSPEGGSLPLGAAYGVHLRSLERMRSDDALVRRLWRARWAALEANGVTVYDWREDDERRPHRWRAALACEHRYTAVVLDAPDRGPASEALRAAIAEGVGVAVWDRRGAFVDERREVVSAIFASVPTASQLPVSVQRLRRTAATGTGTGGASLLGRHLAFFWDDPNRLVDVPDNHSGAGFGTIDSEER
ncbi:hypothetical protein ACFY93_06990 [Streptomyces sp. NPDC008313]|uniref:VMAP-C domain-containing protein n=1 Tax=Streptomyces sp. NPDC008313 TaxID=3364826 RepID=UPI0036EF1989